METERDEEREERKEERDLRESSSFYHGVRNTVSSKLKFRGKRKGS